MGAARRDPFHPAVVAPKAPPEAAAPAMNQPVVEPPAPPPMPYQYLGGTKGPTGQLERYLSRGGTMVLVEPGALLDSTYRVDAVTDTEVRLTYLPLGVEQRLAIGTP